jgi:small subunit ribosomal protein S1
MSWEWTNHPSERVAIDQEIEVQILRIDYKKEWIFVGLKQTQKSPWDRAADLYSPGTVVKGTVRRLTNYGAFVEIEERFGGLLHVKNMAWDRMISNPSEMVELGQVIECRVLSVDRERQYFDLRLVETSATAAHVGDGNAANQSVETASVSVATTGSSGPV